MDFKIALNEETKKLAEEYLEEFKALNDNLDSLVLLLAPWLGGKAKGREKNDSD